MNGLAISLLGPLQVSRDGEPVIRFGADTAQALLAYLAMHAPMSCRREALAGLLWPDRPQAAAFRDLRQALNRLRQALGEAGRADTQVRPYREDTSAHPRRADTQVRPYLGATRATIGLTLDDLWLDVALFDQSLAACRRHAHRRLDACRACMQRLGAAAELCRGEFMADFSLPSAPFEEWLRAQREHYHRQAMDAFYCLASYHERRGELEQVQRYAQRQLALEPWCDAAHRQMMRALALRGQRDAALAQYQACRRVLSEELGVEPEAETTALYQRIKQVDLEGLGDLRGLSHVPPHNLPALLTPFVGRERELAQIGEWVEDPACRLLTVVGLGGMGKTRLALEAATEHAYAFEHGTFLAPLAGVSSVDGLIPAVAAAIGYAFPGRGDARQQLVDYLRRKEMLLMLDNFEHLLTGAALVSEILHAAPGVKVLVTSRARLNLRGEQVLALEGMEYLALTPDPSPARGRGEPVDARRYGALVLFRHSARRVRPDFELTDAVLPDVAQICRLVEGMPLGILLAAAWMATLTPAEIARQLEAEAARGLDFLAAGWPDEVERHRSMRAVMDSCWQMLGEREQQAFAALSVFRGGFTATAAQAVAGADLLPGHSILSTLRSLVDKSLITLAKVAPAELAGEWSPPDLRKGEEGRYHVHELLRQYGEERLSADVPRLQQVRDRHAAYYAGAAVGWEAALKGMRGREALAELGIEIHNAQAAWQWLSDAGDLSRLAPMVHAMGQFYASWGSYQQGESVFGAAADRLLPAEQDAMTPEPAALRHVQGRLLTWQSRYAFLRGRRAQAAELLRQAQAALDEAERAGQDVRAARAWALHSHWEQVADTDRPACRPAAEQSLALYRELGDPWGIICVLSDLGITTFFDGAYPVARQIFEERQSLSRQWGIGDDIHFDDSVWWLSEIAARQGEADWAERMVREWTVPWVSSGDRMTRANGLFMLGCVLDLCGQYAAVEPLLEEGVAVLQELGADVLVYRLRGYLVNTRLHLGRWERAHELGHEQVQRSMQLEAWVFAALALMRLAQVSLVTGAYEEAARTLEDCMATMQRAGARAHLGEALGVRALVAHGLGQADRAREDVRQALRLGLECRAVYPLLLSMPVAALLFVDQGRVERAVELWALLLRYPPVANSRWYEEVAGRHLAAVAAALPAEVRAAAQARGRARGIWATARELLEEL